jgi:hypothetical protein
MINNLAIGLALGLIVIGLIAISIAGIRNVINGKSEVKRVSIMLVPVAVFGISYATLGTYQEAGMATMLFMMGVMVLGILVTGTRGTFKF